MGIIRIDVDVENPVQPEMRVTLRHVLVDSGAELSWFPANVLEALDVERRKTRRFLQPDGSTLERSTGALSIYLARRWTVDEVVFAEPEDLIVLGTRSLVGLGLRLDAIKGRLVDSGSG